MTLPRSLRHEIRLDNAEDDFINNRNKKYETRGSWLVRREQDECKKDFMRRARNYNTQVGINGERLPKRPQDSR